MSLTVRNLPSYQFANTGALTVPRINLLGQPTFEVTGTLSTSEIADGAVTAVKTTPGAFFYGDGTLAAGIYAVDLTPNMPAGYVTGAVIRFKANAANAGAVDVNCDSLGAKDLGKFIDTASGTVFSELEAGDIRAGQVVEAIYDGTRFQLFSTPGLKILDYFTAAGTNTYTATPVPNYTAYSQLTGRPIVVSFTNGNSSACTLNLNGLGAVSIYKYGDVTELVNGDIRAGQVMLIVYDGSDFQLLSELGQAPPDIAIVGDHKNLVITTNSASPNSQVDITADEIVLRDSNNRNYLATSVSRSGVAVTASGANGLDTGVEASSTWYFIWVIYNGTTVSGLLSTSSTAPTMPSGYTYKALAGAVRNDGSSNFIQFYQRDKNVGQTVQTALSLGNAASWTSISLSAYVPSIAKTVGGSCLVAASVGGVVDSFISTEGSGSASAINETRFYATATSDNLAAPYSGLVVKSNGIYYRVATGNLTVRVSNYTI